MSEDTNTARDGGMETDHGELMIPSRVTTQRIRTESSMKARIVIVEGVKL